MFCIIPFECTHITSSHLLHPELLAACTIMRKYQNQVFHCLTEGFGKHMNLSCVGWWCLALHTRVRFLCQSGLNRVSYCMGGLVGWHEKPWEWVVWDWA